MGQGYCDTKDTFVTLSLSPREPERQRGGGNIAIGQILPYRPRDRDSVWDGGSALGGRAVECVVFNSINTVFNSIPWAIGILSRKCHNIALSPKG